MPKRAFIIISVKKQNINYQLLCKKLNKKYKLAFANFSEIYRDVNETDFLNNFDKFLRQYNLLLNCKKTIALNPNFAGTFSFTVIMSTPTKELLGKSNNKISYYGIKSLTSAKEKGIEKCFEIIDLILRNKK